LKKHRSTSAFFRAESKFLELRAQQTDQKNNLLKPAHQQTLMQSASVKYSLSTMNPPNRELRKRLAANSKSDPHLSSLKRKQHFIPCKKITQKLDKLSIELERCWKSGKMQSEIIKSNPKLKQTLIHRCNSSISGSTLKPSCQSQALLPIFEELSEMKRRDQDSPVQSHKEIRKLQLDAFVNSRNLAAASHDEKSALFKMKSEKLLTQHVKVHKQNLSQLYDHIRAHPGSSTELLNTQLEMTEIQKFYNQYYSESQDYFFQRKNTAS
jgi:hypothetical protein